MKVPDTLEGLTEIFRGLGARNPHMWASSQLKESIPQLHRYLWLREAWKSVVPDEGYAWMDSEISTAQLKPDAPYSGIGGALERCLEKGVDRRDLSQAFAGIMGNGPTKFRRPLVAVSQPNFHDPDGWKRTKLTDQVVASLRKAFRREYPHVDRCKDEQIVEHNWAFPDSALTFPVAYASNKSSFLVEASLNAGDCGCVDQPDDPESEPWFFVSGSGTIRRVGSFMSLLDAGDYDNDGKSEVIFFLSQGENTDGFILFDASFENQVSLHWHYH